MANTDFNKTRNDFQQYDLVTVFQASETRLMRHLHVATMAIVTKADGDTIQCMPFPIRENTTANNIYAFNIGKVDYKVGDKVLVIFTDRDFRKNYDSATTSERSIGTTNDAQLHSIDYGVVIPMTKAYEGSLEASRKKINDHIDSVNNPHEIDHGDKFKGDLESTTKVSAPVVEVANHLENSNGDVINLPDKEGTLTIVNNVSTTSDVIKESGSLYEWFGDNKNKVYNVFLKVSGRPPIRMDFNEESQDFLTADGKSCLDYPEMEGVLYETY